MIEDGYLFEFVTPGKSFYYTNVDTDIVHNAKTYQAVPIRSDSSLKISSLADNSEWEIVIAPGASIAELWEDTFPEDPIEIIVFRFNKVVADWVYYWQGYVSHPKWTEKDLTLMCESEFSSIRTRGLRSRMQAACGHDLYSPYCGVDRALYRITRTVTNISGTQIEINGSALVDNTLAQGYAEWINTQSSTLVRRSIASNLNGGEINFTYLVANLQLGQSIDLYPGCNKVLDGDCLNKFADNTINHGGKTHLTVKQPFGSGSRIF